VDVTPTVGGPGGRRSRLSVDDLTADGRPSTAADSGDTAAAAAELERPL